MDGGIKATLFFMINLSKIYRRIAFCITNRVTDIELHFCIISRVTIVYLM